MVLQFSVEHFFKLQDVTADEHQDEDAWDEEGEDELKEEDREEDNTGESSNDNNENESKDAKETTTVSTEAAKPEGGSQGSNGGDVAASQGGGETTPSDQNSAIAKPAEVKDPRTEPEETKNVEEPKQEMKHEQSKQDRKHEEPKKDEKHEESNEDVTPKESTKAQPNKNQEGQEDTTKDASASSSKNINQEKENEEGKLSTWFALICVCQIKRHSWLVLANYIMGFLSGSYTYDLYIIHIDHCVWALPLGFEFSFLGKYKMELLEKRAAKLELLRQFFDSTWNYDFQNAFARSSIFTDISTILQLVRQFTFD